MNTDPLLERLQESASFQAARQARSSRETPDSGYEHGTSSSTALHVQRKEGRCRLLR